jgi:rare lipoprotein A
MKNILLASFLVIHGWATICAQSADSIRRRNARVEVPRVQTGIASYYHSKFQGRPTASGEKYDENKMTAAHNRLPMGTMVRVTNLRNKRSVIVRINDRLHHRNTRLIDLSRAAALKLGYVARGLAKVRVEVLKDQ